MKNIIQQIESNRIKLFSLWQKTGEANLLNIPEIYGFYSKYTSSRLNRIFKISNQITDLEFTIDEMKNFYSQKGISFLIHTGPTTAPENIESLLLNSDFELIGTEIGMAMPLEELDDTLIIPDEVTITKVNDADSLKKWCYVFGKSFGADDSDINEMFDLELKLGFDKKLQRIHYLCYYDDIPAGSATIFYDDDTVGIYCIGVLNEFRRKGIGKIITKKPLIDSKMLGKKTAVLHSTPLGKPIYKKLGFKEFCTLKRFLFLNKNLQTHQLI